MPAGKEQSRGAATDAPAKEEVGKAPAHARLWTEGVAQCDELAEVAYMQRPEERLEDAERNVGEALPADDQHCCARHRAQGEPALP